MGSALDSTLADAFLVYLKKKKKKKKKMTRTLSTQILIILLSKVR